MVVRVMVSRWLGWFRILFVVPMLWLILASIDRNASWGSKWPHLSLVNFHNVLTGSPALTSEQCGPGGRLDGDSVHHRCLCRSLAFVLSDPLQAAAAAVRPVLIGRAVGHHGHPCLFVFSRFNYLTIFSDGHIPIGDLVPLRDLHPRPRTSSMRRRQTWRRRRVY